jgi:hypothetical protein
MEINLHPRLPRLHWMSAVRCCASVVQSEIEFFLDPIVHARTLLPPENQLMPL